MSKYIPILFSFFLVFPTFADDFSDHIRERYPQTAHAYDQHAHAWENETDAKEKDALAQIIVTDIGSWIFHRNWDYFKQASEAQQQIYTEELGLANVMGGLLASLQFDTAKGRENFRVWFKKRHNARENEGDLFVIAKDIWLDFCQIEQCTTLFEDASKIRAFNPHDIPIEELVLPLSQFKAIIPAIVYYVGLDERVVDGRLTHIILKTLNILSALPIFGITESIITDLNPSSQTFNHPL